MSCLDVIFLTTLGFPPSLKLVTFRDLNIVSLNLEMEIGIGMGIDITSNAEKENQRLSTPRAHVNVFTYESCK